MGDFKDKVGDFKDKSGKSQEKLACSPNIWGLACTRVAALGKQVEVQPQALVLAYTRVTCGMPCGTTCLALVARESTAPAYRAELKNVAYAECGEGFRLHAPMHPCHNLMALSWRCRSARAAYAVHLRCRIRCRCTCNTCVHSIFITE